MTCWREAGRTRICGTSSRGSWRRRCRNLLLAYTVRMPAPKRAAHEPVLYDREAARKPMRLSVNSDLLEKARELDVDLAATLEEALALEVHRRRREAWLKENREAVE